MAFRITGLSPEPFLPLAGLSDEALRARGVLRCVVDASPGYPDRIELRDAAIGETVLLLNYEHQPADTPFRASHAIYVREGATARASVVDAVPAALWQRPLSLRGFDAAGMLRAADLAEGDAIAPAIGRLLADPAIAYLHAHYARPGCYAARVDRA
jgi:hypothetical protein